MLPEDETVLDEMHDAAPSKDPLEEAVATSEEPVITSVTKSAEQKAFGPNVDGIRGVPMPDGGYRVTCACGFRYTLPAAVQGKCPECHRTVTPG